MTAEVVIMNKTAIGLAADSAVTIPYLPEKKIYYSINKLFRLSECYPVGIMIYGRAEFMEVPWQTIIKAYRKKLNRTGFDTLREYAEGFLDFLRDVDSPFFPESQQQKYFGTVVLGIFSGIREEVDSRVAAIIAEEGVIADERIESIICEVIEESHSAGEAIQSLPSVREDHIEQIVNGHEETIESAREEVFQEQPISEESVALLREISKFLLTKGPFPEEIRSGIVIAGFGEQDIFPSYHDYWIEGVIDGYLKHYLAQEARITFDLRAVIRAFAQGEMVSTFMEGIDPDYRETILHYLPDLVTRSTQNIVNRIPLANEADRTRLLHELAEANQELVNDFVEAMRQYERERHVDPILTGVRDLPKDELAVMAESLVNITSFRQRVAVGAETVGGPIDVAVISKGDGFVWIKRKDYFEPEKNPHLFTH